MKLSHYFFNTYRDNPSPAESISHSLMLRSGMIKQLAAGIYTWLPLGLRVLRKLTEVIRQEMDNAGGIEISMPVLQPSHLWKKSGRWQIYGNELMRLQDRHKRDFCLGPTHEEVVSDLARENIQSYKQLPINLYQIQTKFRDEIRPRFGVMRGREFLMKDAYSFHIDEQSLQTGYESMRECYHRIFKKINLNYCMVEADSGNIGGNTSHEFHALVSSGEDRIALSDGGDYAANVEQAKAVAPPKASVGKLNLEMVATGNLHTIEEISKKLQLPATQSLKSLAVLGVNNKPVLLVLRGDDQLSLTKAAKLDILKQPIQLLSTSDLEKHKLLRGVIGPINLDHTVIADHNALAVADFCCGANVIAHHYTGANWGRDCPWPQGADLREVKKGDPSPDGKGVLKIEHGTELGHIFQLGQKYTRALDVQLQDQDKNKQYLWMGCYGIGVGRAVAAVIEQNYDERGIIFPEIIAPYSLAIVPIEMERNSQVKKVTLDLYEKSLACGIDTLLDDRNQRIGVKLSDMDLIGIPHRIIISERNLANNKLEYLRRSDNKTIYLDLNNAIDELQQRCGVVNAL